MSKKLYKKNNSGGYEIIDKTSQQPFVMIENYIIDLWMPIIGVDALGLYTAYKRAIFKENKVIRRSQAELGKLLRIGKNKLTNLNEVLQDCGFIKVTKPTGKEKLEHKPTKIEVFDPPKDIKSEIVKKYCQDKYSTFFEWFVETESNPKLTKGGNETSENTNAASRESKNEYPDNTNSISPILKNEPSHDSNSSLVENKEIINKNINYKNNNNKTVDELMRYISNTLFENVSRETMKKLGKLYSIEKVKETIDILNLIYRNSSVKVKSPSALLQSCMKSGVSMDLPYNSKPQLYESITEKNITNTKDNFDYYNRIEQFLQKFNVDSNGNYHHIWNSILDKLKNSLNSRTYDFWIKSLKLIGAKDNKLLLLTPNRFSAKWLRENYQEKFNEIFHELELDYVRVLFIPASKE